MAPHPKGFLAAVQRRTAQVAISASTVRGQGARGLVKAARSYLAKLPLKQFAVSRPQLFQSRLNRATAAFKRALAAKRIRWGVARKMLNIFLRDALYTCYLREHFHLDQAERFCELPLDSKTARQLRKQDIEKSLPRWKGVKYLEPPVSDQYQFAAQRAAHRQGIARVHLDAYWWADNGK